MVLLLAPSFAYMILSILLIIPLLGILFLVCSSYIRPFNQELINSKNIDSKTYESSLQDVNNLRLLDESSINQESRDKKITLFVFTLEFLVSLIILIFFNLSRNHFQYVTESINIYEYNLYLGIDGISIYFVLLTTFIMPIVLLSN